MTGRVDARLGWCSAALNYSHNTASGGWGPGKDVGGDDPLPKCPVPRPSACTLPQQASLCRRAAQASAPYNRPLWWICHWNAFYLFPVVTAVSEVQCPALPPTIHSPQPFLRLQSPDCISPLSTFSPFFSISEAALRRERAFSRWDRAPASSSGLCFCVSGFTAPCPGSRGSHVSTHPPSTFS